MLTGILALVAVGGCAVVASWFMWWATKRSAVWAMAAGSLLAFCALVGAIAIAWFLTRAAFGS
jgi:hypothetical protein